MTRSHHLKKEISKHSTAIYSNTKESKKSGYGAGNWGSYSGEISEGIDIVQSGMMAKGEISMKDLGMEKLSTSASSDSSSFSQDSNSSSTSSTSSEV